MTGWSWSTFWPLLFGGLLAAVGHRLRSMWEDEPKRWISPGALDGLLKRLVGRTARPVVAQKVRAEESGEPSHSLLGGFAAAVRAGLERTEGELRTWPVAGLMVLVVFIVLLRMLHGSFDSVM